MWELSRDGCSGLCKEREKHEQIREDGNLEHVQERRNSLVWMVPIQTQEKETELTSWKVFGVRRKNYVGSGEPQKVS